MFVVALIQRCIIYFFTQLSDSVQCTENACKKCFQTIKRVGVRIKKKMSM